MNYLTYLKSLKCPECLNTNIKYDYKRKEHYCSRCGLILTSPEPTTKKELEFLFNILNRWIVFFHYPAVLCQWYFIFFCYRSRLKKNFINWKNIYFIADVSYCKKTQKKKILEKIIYEFLLVSIKEKKNTPPRNNGGMLFYFLCLKNNSINHLARWIIVAFAIINSIYFIFTCLNCWIVYHYEKRIYSFYKRIWILISPMGNYDIMIY